MANLLFHLSFPEPTYSEQIIFDSFLDSVDGWNKQLQSGGQIEYASDHVIIRTGGAAGGGALMYKKLGFPRLIPTWTKRRSFKIRAEVYHANDAASENFISSGMEMVGARGFGFQFINNKVQGYARNGTPSTFIDLITGLSPPWTRDEIWEAIFTPGSRVDFFISGSFLGTITTNLPTGTSYADYLARLVTNAAAAVQHTIKTSEIRVVQET